MILLISSLTWLLISVFQADQFLSTEPELPGCINCFCSGLTIICFLFRRRLSMQCFNFPIPFLKIIFQESRQAAAQPLAELPIYTETRSTSPGLPAWKSSSSSSQIRAVFQDSALGFTLVDSSLEQTIEADQLAVNSTSQVTIALTIDH